MVTAITAMVLGSASVSGIPVSARNGVAATNRNMAATNHNMVAINHNMVVMVGNPATTTHRTGITTRPKSVAMAITFMSNGATTTYIAAVTGITESRH